MVYLAEELGTKIIAYADDTRLLFTWEKNTDPSSAKHCLSSVFKWLAAAQLKCNKEKSEILLLRKFPPTFRDTLWPPESPPCLPQLESPSRIWGGWLEENLSFYTQVKKLAGICFGLLKTLRKFLPLLLRAAKETVISALILSRLDYANALYVGIPGYLLKKLQVIQNAAARLLLDMPSRSSVSHHLCSLQWLPVAVRVKFKSLVIAHRALYGQGPTYLQKRFSFYAPLRQLRSSSQLLALVPRFKCQRLGGSSRPESCRGMERPSLCSSEHQGSTGFQKAPENTSLSSIILHPSYVSTLGHSRVSVLVIK